MQDGQGGAGVSGDAAGEIEGEAIVLAAEVGDQDVLTSPYAAIDEDRDVGIAGGHDAMNGAAEDRLAEDGFVEAHEDQVRGA